ncbi:MAG TPA: hypothetical protein VFU15_15315 [Bacteroidia bacterium]|nr:hypothetical protein [Bacteroidia bacterium]
MKNLLLFSFAVAFFFIRASAQNDNPDRPKTLIGDVHLFKNIHCDYGMLDAGYLQGFIHGTMTRGFSWNVNGVMNKNWSTGLWMDLQESRHITPSLPELAVKPDYVFGAFGWNNELLLMPNRVVNFSFPLHVGMGIASYNDRSVYTAVYPAQYGYYAQPKSIGKGYYFVAEPGANMFVNLYKNVSLAIGASYRFVSGYSSIGGSADLSGLNMRATFRVRLYDDAGNEKS